MTEESRTVRLAVPAERAYVAVLRMTAAALAARLDFTLEDIEDLQMAVGEASALLLDDGGDAGDAGSEGGARGPGELWARFALGDGSMHVTVGTDRPDHSIDRQVDTDSFAWQMLSALTLGAQVAEGAEAVEFDVASTASV